MLAYIKNILTFKQDTYLSFSLVYFFQWALGHLAPLGSMILVIQLSVFIEYISFLMVFKKSSAIEKTKEALDFLIKAGSYVVAIIWVLVIQSSLFPKAGLVDWACGSIVVFQCKIIMRNFGIYLGVNLWDDFLDTIGDLIKKRNGRI